MSTANADAEERDPAQVRYDRARTLYDLGRHTEALAELALLLAAKPNWVDALYEKARNEYELERYADLRATADRALAVDPTDVQSHMARSGALFALSIYDEAVVSAREAVRLDPEDYRLYVWLTRVALWGGHTDVALDAATRALDLKPEHAETYLLLGSIHHERGATAAARAAYERAIERDPDDPWAFEGLATLDDERFRLGTALRRLASALSLDPQSADLRRDVDVLTANVATLPIFGFVLAAPVLALLAVADLAGWTGTWWPRAALGVAVAVVGGGLVARMLARLPKGLRRSMRGLRSRLQAREHIRLWWAHIPVTLLFLAAAFLPAPAAAPLGAAVVALVAVPRLARLPGLRWHRIPKCIPQSPVDAKSMWPVRPTDAESPSLAPPPPCHWRTCPRTPAAAHPWCPNWQPR